MDMEEFLSKITERFFDLPEEDKDKIRSFKQTEEAKLISYVLGPELSTVIDRLGPPRNMQPQAEPAPMSEPVMQEEEMPRRRGLGMRP